MKYKNVDQNKMKYKIKGTKIIYFKRKHCCPKKEVKKRHWKESILSALQLQLFLCIQLISRGNWKERVLSRSVGLMHSIGNGL